VIKRGREHAVNGTFDSGREKTDPSLDVLGFLEPVVVPHVLAPFLFEFL
jgi:hypothetical protein